MCAGFCALNVSSLIHHHPDSNLEGVLYFKLTVFTRTKKLLLRLDGFR